MKNKHLTASLALSMALGCVLCAFVMFGAVGCPSAGGGGEGEGEAECATTDDCPDGQICQNGQCVAAECTTNDDCADGEVCQDGECVAGGAPNIEAGQVTYDERCKSCHGDPGQDNGTVAGDVIAADEALIESVLTGEDHPPVEGLTEEDYANLGAYIEDERQDDGDGAPDLDAPYATVTFDHAFHLQAFECTTCHHPEPVDAKLAACDVCHLDEWVGGVPRLKEAMHTPGGVSVVGNAGCRACHDVKTEDGSWQCSFCHQLLNDL
jgi:mono/diheme cytochrome c family protein